jgi:hypothetical protein
VNALLKVVDSLITTDNTWASWSRKILSSLVLSGLLFVGFKTYVEYQEGLTNLQTIEERIKADPDAFSDVKGIINDAHHAYESIAGIWLYSWPDAHTLDTVHSTGSRQNPLPLGHFWASDAYDVGKLTLRICTELNRTAKNTACSVWGNEDAWGILVVVWDEEKEKPDHYKDIVGALAHKIGHLLYPHHTSSS